ncbi:glycosyltransferase family 4 protein [Geomonas sp. Red32]|uniref:glycosyltransferase family 4 protein n=1 Tax=Geomonas sp. Red32 TaxID=2912856 RepID=UPI00202CC199|nr:glycosyltransferase family 4 protein [Geomonas sp. Red32]
MKIALVTYALQIGGVETFLRRLARYYRAKGHDVCFLETTEKGRWSDSFQQDGFRVERILPNPWRSRREHALAIGGFLKDFDLVLLNDAPFAQAALGLLPDRAVAIPVLHMYLTSMVKTASANAGNWDALAAVCPAGARSAIHHGADAGRVSVIANGVEVPESFPRESRGREAGGPLRIGYIGSLNHSQKGILYIPAIVERLLAEQVDFSLDVIGAGPDAEALARGLTPAGERVVQHGPLPNDTVVGMLGQLDVLLMPSHFEGLPVVLLEAMSRGVVPVVSRLEGCTDFAVTDGRDGLLIPVGDVEGFACALKRLATEKDLLAEFGKAAWRTASERFSSQGTAEGYLALADDCLQRKKAGKGIRRSGTVDDATLDDFPYLPVKLVRPARKVLRTLRLMPPHRPEPFLYVVPGEP